MRKRPPYLWATLMVAVAAVASHAAPSVSPEWNVPEGWTISGPTAEDYTLASDTAVRRGGTRSAHLASTPSAGGDSGVSLIQGIRADRFHGKRLRFSAAVQTEGAGSALGLFMRVTGGPQVLGMDNMLDRRIKPNTRWSVYEVVLDVPKEADLILFGLNLVGPGSVWLDECKLEEVPETVAVTNRIQGPQAPSPIAPPELYPAEPTNLDLELPAIERKPIVLKQQALAALTGDFEATNRGIWTIQVAEGRLLISPNLMGEAVPPLRELVPLSEMECYQRNAPHILYRFVKEAGKVTQLHYIVGREQAVRKRR